MGIKEITYRFFADNSNLVVNPSYVRSWLDVLSRTPRVAPFLSKDDPFITAFKKELEDHTDEVNVQREILDGMFTFYDSTSAKLNIYQVASVTFDLLLLLVFLTGHLDRVWIGHNSNPGSSHTEGIDGSSNLNYRHLCLCLFLLFLLDF